MLSRLVLLLGLANAGYFVWSQGFLAPYGLSPATQSEPQRLAQQIRPEALRILRPPETRLADGGGPPAPGSATAGTTAATATPTECLQAGLFNDQQTAALRERLQTSLPAGSWVLESSVEPARWMVYMGRYSGPDAVAKKRGELRQLGVSFEPLNNPALEPGLSLGTFPSQAEADAALARIAKRGVRTAKIIQSRAETRGQKLKLAAVDAALRAQLGTLKPQLGGKALQSCQ